MEFCGKAKLNYESNPWTETGRSVGNRIGRGVVERGDDNNITVKFLNGCTHYGPEDMKRGVGFDIGSDMLLNVRVHFEVYLNDFANQSGLV